MAETSNGVVVPVQGATPVVAPAANAPITVGLSADAIAAIQAAGRTAAPAPTPAQPGTPAAPVATFSPNTGDQVIDFTVQNFAKANGVSAELYNSAIAPAVQSGDISRLDLGSIAAKGGNEAVKAAIELVQTLGQHNAAKSQSTVEFVHQQAGGKEAWTAAVGHLNMTQPDFVKQQYLGFLESGNPEQVKYAVGQIMQAAKAAGVVSQTLPLEPGSGAPSGAQGLSAAEFSKAFDELQKKYPNRSFESGPAGEEYKALLARRRLGVQSSR